MKQEQAVIRFRRLFRGRKTAHGEYVQGPDGQKLSARTLDAPVPERMWEDHLAGVGPFLGIVPITENNTCYFGAIDYDSQVETEDMEHRVRILGLPLVVCRSKSGGAHLYVFFIEPIAAGSVMERLRQWAKMLGISRNPPEPKFPKGRPIEVFPKQASLKPSEQGNWINLPYYGEERYAVNKTGRLSLEGFLDHAESLRVSESRFMGLQSSTTFGDGPPCLQTIHAEGIGEGLRNQTLFNVAIYFKLRDPERMPELLEEYNRDFVDPPLTERELGIIVKSVQGKEYGYKCSDSPLHDYCQKGECKGRKHGVDGFKAKKDLEGMPELTELTRINTDPPLWTVKVDGKKVELNTDDLMTPGKFRRVCLEKLSMVFPNMKQSVWDEVLVGLLAERKEVAAPEDAGARGEFLVLFVDFLEKRLAARNRDDILLGKPWEEEGRVYFRSQDLTNHLKRRNFRDLTVNRVYTILRGVGADHHQMKVKGANVQVWSVPSPNGTQTEDFVISTNGKEPHF